MADLLPVHRYAAGALFALALHQVQLHQHSVCFPLDACSIVEQSFLVETELEENNVASWAGPHCGLLRPIFRYLKLDPKTWAGLEQTALSPNAKVHIEAFLRILSEDEGGGHSSNDAEMKLAQAVDTVSQKLEEDCSCEATISGLTGSGKEIRPEKQSYMASEDHSTQVDPKTVLLKASTSSSLPLLQEDYFGSSSHMVESYQSEKTQNNSECKCPEQAQSCSTDSCLNEDLAMDGGLLTQQRRVAVLYELLSAAVADLPPDEGLDESRLRSGYDARQRVTLRLLATWLGVKWAKMAAMELLVAYSAMAAQEDVAANKNDKESESTSWAKWKRGGLIGAAAVTGGALLALTGGLAAPAIAAGLSALAPTLGTIIPVIGSTGFAAAAAAAGSTVGSAAVAASFGAAGAGLSGSKMARRIGGVEEFGFEGIGENLQQGRLAVGIVISGFINDPNDFTRPWKGHDGDLERYALIWETKTLILISTAIQDWLTSSIAKEMMKQGAMLTVLSTLLTALTWPSALLTLIDFIDSKWAIAVDRSDKAGKLLAHVLLKGLQGNRPVTLIGFSLGTRVIFKCLERLAKKGEYGRIVERVVLLGAPLTIENQKWKEVRKVVAGRFVNAYSTTDWTLAIAYRASLMSQGLAGIQAVNVPGIENVDITDLVSGHSSYLSKLGEILEVINIDSCFPCIRNVAEL